MNRRNFFKQSAGGIIAAAVAPSVLPALDSLGALDMPTAAPSVSKTLTFMRPDHFPLGQILRDMERRRPSIKAPEYIEWHEIRNF